MISWAVVGHEQRLLAATTLAHQLGGLVTVDDGTHGADANHLKAWDITAANDITDWCGVMEDDAAPVAGFTEHADAALRQAPAPIVSFYLGRGRPVRWQSRIHVALQQADLDGAHWITSTHLLHAVAVVMRTELRDTWLDWAHTSTLPIDERLGAWARTAGHRIAYTTPSLVDHQDGPTLIQHRDGRPRDKPRVAWRTGTRQAWTNKAVSM